MPFTPYPLPARGAGSMRRTPVEGTNQAILFSHLHDRSLQEDGVEVPVTLLPDPRGGGFKVKWDYGVIGTLPREFREAYPQLERITGSHLTPEVTARVSVDGARGGLRAEILLPEPQWAVPVNDPPEGAWTILPSGPPARVDLSAGVDVPSDELAALYRAQLLVGLSLLNERVTVTYDKRVLGVLDREASVSVSGALRHFGELELGCVARAFLDGDEVTVECARTEDLDDDALEPEVSPLPALQIPAFEQPAPSTPGVTESTDGTWAVHMSSASFEAITPEKLAEHKRRRRINSPVVPERPAPHTEVIPTVDLPDDAPVQGVPSGGRTPARPAPEPEERSGAGRWGWVIAVVLVIALLVVVWLLLSGGSVA